jgi:hypothetical protein
MKKEDHQIQTEHHVAMCKMHTACHKALEDGEMKDFHKAAADEHLRMADHHAESAESAKALMADSPSKILSPAERFGKTTDDGIHGAVAPNPNRILVTRDGSPTPEEITKVAGKHAHIFERESRAAQ